MPGRCIPPAEDSPGADQVPQKPGCEEASINGERSSKGSISGRVCSVLGSPTYVLERALELAPVLAVQVSGSARTPVSGTDAVNEAYNSSAYEPPRGVALLHPLVHDVEGKERQGPQMPAQRSRDSSTAIHRARKECERSGNWTAGLSGFPRARRLHGVLLGRLQRRMGLPAHEKGEEAMGSSGGGPQQQRQDRVREKDRSRGEVHEGRWKKTWPKLSRARRRRDLALLAAPLPAGAQALARLLLMKLLIFTQIFSKIFACNQHPPPGCPQSTTHRRSGRSPPKPAKRCSLRPLRCPSSLPTALPPSPVPTWLRDLL
ncbi:MAG: hypothetical protein M1821_009301, partial [Bathelium mastoideum]